MKRQLAVAVAGKGGTGKTTVSALLIDELIRRGDGAVLAVDADPNANLGELLGLEVRQTIGGLREEVLQHIAELPPGIAKDRYLEQGLHDCLVEGPGVDLLVMGRGEGPRCYCMVNHILRKYMEILRTGYRYVVIDNEAGMEHLSRRTTSNVDFLLIVARDDPISIRSAAKIAALARELELHVGQEMLVLNDLRGEVSPRAREELQRTKIPLAGVVPHDEGILELALAGQPLKGLAQDAPARRAVAQVLQIMEAVKEGDLGDSRHPEKVGR